MNTLFLIPYPENENTNNLYRKFTSQINSAKKLGGKVFYTSYDEKSIYINELGDESQKKIIGKTVSVHQNFVQMHFIMGAIRKWIKTATIDLVYMRKITPSPSYKRTFTLLKKKNIPLVVEIPTYPGNNESKNSSRKLFFFAVRLMSKLFSNAYKNNVSLYTLIGEKADCYNGAPAINIENGLDVQMVPVKNGFENHDSELHLLVAAYFSYWHGYDRLINGLLNYYKNSCAEKKVFVHICGKPSDDSLETIMKIVKENNLEDYAIYHGYLTGDDLNAMYDKCDVAIGSLGLHRQKIIVDTTLKLPEYTARAILFIYCANSNNVNADGKYYLKVKEDETHIDILEIINFFESLDRDNIQKEMRSFAEKSLGWDAQFKKVVDFFNKGGR